jgi:RHS repeat-associated protein
MQGQTTTESTVASTFQTDYCVNYVYEKSGTAAPVLKRILTPQGYVQTYGSIPINYLAYWSYVYPLKDHLGNTRVNLTSCYLGSNTNKTYSASGQIDYYPFGMERSAGGSFDTSGGPSAIYNSESNPYLFSGKEIDRLNGLNEYDFGARWDDPAVGGWPTVDPLAENNYSISPYAYCAGNPVNRFDPDGMDWYTSTDGKTVYWQKGNDKVDGYTNSETYTQKVNNYHCSRAIVSHG